MHIRSIVTLLIALSCGCSREAYVEHRLSLEKSAADCDAVGAAFKLTSNFGGERYEFEKCLPENYDSGQLTTERRGDTVLVRFNAIGGPGNAYKVKLDIDSYPRYSYITIDDDTYTVVQK